MTLNIEQHECEWGMTFHPPGDGPFPAVLVLHGSEGGWSGYSYLNASVLAAHGFLALPIPYSKGGSVWHAGDIHQVSLDRTVRALAAMRSLPRSNGTAAIYGVSRGAEHALLAAALMGRDRLDGMPDAVAVLSPTDTAQGAFISARTVNEHDPDRAASDEPDLPAWTWRGSSDGLTRGSPIEIEHFQGPLLIAQGTEDALWPADMTRRLLDRLHRHGCSPEVHWYEGQGHGAWGETANLHWEQVIAFFRRHLPDPA